jgi:hypothetical protein
MEQITSRRTIALIGWFCAWIVIISQFSLVTPNVAAQEPTDTSTASATPPSPPVPAETLTPEASLTAYSAITPTGTVSSTVTPTATVVSRTVDFRVDDDDIDPGECVTFSWLVRGDIDRIEFRAEDKDAILVSSMDSRDECPAEETDYDFIVTWLDGTQTTRSIEIEVDHTSDNDNAGDSSNGGGTPSPGGTGPFVPVTPVPFEQSSQQTDDGEFLAPIGVLGSVRLLPETGVLGPPSATAGAPAILIATPMPTSEPISHRPQNHMLAAQPRWGLWSALAGGLGLLLASSLVAVIISLVRLLRQSH